MTKNFSSCKLVIKNGRFPKMKWTIEKIGLSPREAGHVLGISEVALGELRRKGVGPPFTKLGGRVIYRADDVEKWLAKHKPTKREE